MVVGTVHDLWADPVPQEEDLDLMELALLSFINIKLFLQEASMDYLDVSDAIFQFGRIDQDVVDIHGHLAHDHVPEHLVHERLKH
jgi:hypothetical protein